MYLAAFFTQNGSYGPLFGEMDFRDGNGRRMTPANTTLVNGISHWTSGNVTDDDLTTYYYDSSGLNCLIVHFTDNEPVETAKFYRGTQQFPSYAPVGIRVYQSDTNYGTTEANWPEAAKFVDETYTASTYGWTDEYELSTFLSRSILLVTNTTAHAAYTNTEAALTSHGHTVTTMLDTALGSVPEGIDLIATVRAAYGSYASWLDARWHEGYPVLLGGCELGQVGTGHAGEDLGVLDDVVTTSADVASLMNIVAHPITDGFEHYTSLNIATGTNYSATDTGTPYGTVLGTLSGNAALVAVEAGDTINGGTAPARLVFNGWLYAGQNDYNTSGLAIIGQSIDWLVAAEKPMERPPNYEYNPAVFHGWSVPL